MCPPSLTFSLINPTLAICVRLDARSDMPIISPHILTHIPSGPSG